MKLPLIILVATMLGAYGLTFTKTDAEPSLAGFSDPFVSVQLAESPVNGKCLLTDGSNNSWSDCASGSFSTTTNTYWAENSLQLGQLSDVSTTTLAQYDVLYWTGTEWNTTSTSTWASAGSQTPWTSAINGAGYALSNVGLITATGFTATDDTSTSTFAGGLSIGTTTSKEALTLGLNNRISLETDQGWVYPSHLSDLIRLKWTTNTAKPAITWYDATTTTPVARSAIVSHEYLSYPDNRHAHISIETSDTSNALQSRFEVPWGCDGSDCDVATASGADFHVGSGGDLKILDGDFFHGASLDIFPNIDSANTTVGLRVGTTSTSSLLLAGLGTDEVVFTDNLTTTGTITSQGTSIILDSSGTATFANDRAGTSNFGSFVWRTAGADQWSMQMRNDSTNNLYLRDNINAVNFMQFSQGGNMSFNPTGNVGIGTTSPYSKLSVAGQVVAQNYVATSTTASSTFEAITATAFGIVGKFFASATQFVVSVAANFTAGLAVLDFLDIPSSTNPTVDAEGELAINTTQASSTIRFHDGTAERSASDRYQKTLKISSSTILSLGGNPLATSTIVLDKALLSPITHLARYCETTTGTWYYRIGNGTASSSAVACTTAGVTETITNGTFTYGSKIYLEVGPITDATSSTIIIGQRYDAD